jgi:hypothetical protein
MLIHHIPIYYTLGLAKHKGWKSLYVTVAVQITTEAPGVEQFPLPGLREMFTYQMPPKFTRLVNDCCHFQKLVP